MAAHTCGDEGHEPGLKPVMHAPTGIFIADILDIVWTIVPSYNQLRLFGKLLRSSGALLS